MDIALYQPDIPQNTGTILRLGACLSLPVHIIEPAGFPASDRAFRRAGLDYLDHVALHRHADWEAFEHWRRGAGRRVVLLTTRASTNFADLTYRKDDILLCGQETRGVPPAVHKAAEARVRVPMAPAMRSLNVAVALAMVAGEALRQLGAFPDGAEDEGSVNHETTVEGQRSRVADDG